MAPPEQTRGIGPRLSRLINRAITGRNETLSFSIAMSAHPLSGALRSAWPSHFNESIEAYMKRSPGPLNGQDTQDIVAFQMANDCKVDGKIGRQTKDALWAAIARARGHAFDWSSFFVGGLVLGFLALML